MATGTMWGCFHITGSGHSTCPICDQIGALTRERDEAVLARSLAGEDLVSALIERDESRATVNKLVRSLDLMRAELESIRGVRHYDQNA